MPKGFAFQADDELLNELANADAEDVASTGEVPQVAPSEPAAAITPVEPEPTKTPRPVEQVKPKVKLQDFEEFRLWQAESDRRFEKQRQQTLQAEVRLQETLNAQQAATTAALEAQLRQTTDPDEMLQAARQLGMVEAEHQARRIREWDHYMDERIAAEELDRNDPRFAKLYSGQEGAAQFEADIAGAKAAKWQREAEQAKQAASPEVIGKLVQQTVAKLLAAQGFDAADLGGPQGTPSSDAAFKLDVQRLQSGAMSSTQFHKKWGESP